MTTRKLRWTTAVALIGAMCVARVAAAQTEVGRVASAVGTLEVQRAAAKSWQKIFVGAPVLLGDSLRTAPDAGARIVLRDDTVIDLGSATRIKIERLAVDAEGQRQRALVRMSDGQARVLLGARDGDKRGPFELETATAIAGGRTAAFVVRYDAKGQHTDVVGLEGATEVQGTIGVLESAAQVGPQQWTRVAKGRLPSPPEGLNQERFAAYVSGLDIVGTGNRETLDVGHPALAGRLLRPEDRPGKAPIQAAAAPAENGSFLHVGVPGETFVQQRSKDLSVVYQPIPEYRFLSPDKASQ